MKTDSYKTAKTIKEYSVKAFAYDFVIPVGSIVSNSTALGCDDTSRFWIDWHGEAERLTGYRNSILAHDLDHYGINIPAEFCEPYKK